ncbi:YggS family pyridoxal phosphate-dependent enzyme [Nocardioides limicola]|uniref:YggS family pyridoxal phosphate-dependent enzyme n=1 Tax=Nocardioides limicola TaxID=2803368 RepID=UPI00193C1555|nr:YggS family pyridoxal phosphate-dependent enzyme [Nocardioides sp. DJM-14]
MSRRDALAANLAAVHARIDDACAAAGRDPGAVQLVVVTKHFPASDVELLAGLGVTHVGENRHQEAMAKAAQVTAPVTWHFIGSLQSNKAAAVASYADVVESVDRAKLVAPLGRGRLARGLPEPLDCLVQVSLDPPSAGPGRAGADPDRVLELAALIAEADGLNVAGVMAVAPLDEDPRAAFARLAVVAERLRSEHPEARVLSAGMSGDLEAAIAHGATHVRVGRAVLGERELNG